MARKLKVWGGQSMLKSTQNLNGSYQTRTIVAATTKKRAIELMNLLDRGYSQHYFDNYWCETGNKLELATATEEGVWVNEGHDYEPRYERRL